MKTIKPVKAILFGAGSRGTHTYAAYAKANPSQLEIAAVAEPIAERRNKIKTEHKIPDENVFESWEDAVVKFPSGIDAVIIATQDQMHLEPCIKAMELNKHILCEKPIVPNLEELRKIEKAYNEKVSKGFDKVFMICHGLKYTPFFSKIKEEITSGKIGKLIGINLIENVGHIHFSHSFCRGNWRRKDESSPMILAKSCHDMDMLFWLAGDTCTSISSYGDLHYFNKKNAPQDAPLRCLDGCPHFISCPYYAPKIYLGSNIGWPTDVITTDLSMEGRTKALENGHYGRCVFHCDNDVVDHQTVNMKFANGVLANFTMSGFTAHTHRTITLFGSAGEITGDMESNKLYITEFSTMNKECIELGKTSGGHGGGDGRFISDFAGLIKDGKGDGRNLVCNSFESHFMAFAAEASRLENAKTIQLDKFKQLH